MSNVHLDVAEKLRLTNIRKYWRYIEQVKIELD